MYQPLVQQVVSSQRLTAFGELRRRHVWVVLA
jgi:hypothetical protein